MTGVPPTPTTSPASVEVANTFDGKIDLGVIGGTGLYHLPCLEAIAVLEPPDTPWGKPSSPITISRVRGERADGEAHEFHVAFIARHGVNHEYPPSRVPFQANIAVLKHMGCKAILSFSAVGSLRQEIRPRDFVLPQQIIDRTKSVREVSYFNEVGLVGHVTFGEPFSKNLADYIYQFKDALHEDCKLHYNDDLIVVCMEGPQFSTRAESRMYRSFGGSVINMSVLPEAKLARECEIPYQIVCMSTDYDAWREELEPVTVETVLGNLAGNAKNANLLTSSIIMAMSKQLPDFMVDGDGLRGGVKIAISTAPDAISEDGKAKLHYLFPDYW